MSPDMAIYVSLASVIIALIALVRNSHKDNKQDAVADVASAARIEAKLDGIQSGVDDLRIELRTTREKVNDTPNVWQRWRRGRPAIHTGWTPSTEKGRRNNAYAQLESAV